MENKISTLKELEEIEKKYDPQLSFREIGSKLNFIIFILLISMSIYHFWASGFGLVREVLHRGIHISYVIGLVFLLFSWKKNITKISFLHFQNVPIIDIIFAILAVVSALYLPLLPSEVLAQRVGNPEKIDVLMGSVLIILTLEATRRSVGYTLPLIAIIFILFALFGPLAPGALKHGGTSWLGFVNHIYITNQGVYGIAVGVMAQYVFLFILFGVLATRVGLGKLFIDLAMLIAGKFSGGPAKVAIFSSAFMGTISGSSIANTVTTGSLTIPAMKKVGYPSHFSGAVEAASSTGGQITPPILGAAAFIMVEYLELPLRDILAAALIPALLHYFGIFIMVHLEAKKLGLRGLDDKELPNFIKVIKDNWLSIIPLIILVYFILVGRTPDLLQYTESSHVLLLDLLNQIIN
jgi:TRAP transporter 4TM/12TM fusion protein